MRERMAPRLTLFVVSICVLFTVAWGECPAQCSGHGECISRTNSCKCSDGYGGLDCSYRIKVLKDGEHDSGTIEKNKWQFYQTYLPSRSDIFWSINETEKSQDCDVYAARDRLPTMFERDYFDARPGKVMVLNPKFAEPGVWYLGIYGFSHCEFNVSVHIGNGGGGDCINQCSEHGKCKGGQCQCDEGFGFLDCSAPYTVLSAGKMVNDIVVVNQWKYYAVDVPNNTARMLVQGNETSRGDIDLYVKNNSLPSLANYDFFDGSSRNVSIVQVDNPVSARWYIGVKGFQSTSFSLQVTFPGVAPVCPNECSHRGKCSGTTCTCDRGFIGSGCEMLSSMMQLDREYQGFVADNQWNHFQARANSKLNLRINVSQVNVSGDVDLYVKREQTPTLFLYDYSDITGKSNFSVVIPEPGNDVWFVSVFGWKASAYSISAKLLDCSCKSSNGKCVGGSAECVCDPGWTGDGCNSEVLTLKQNTVVDATVTKEEWTYFSFQCSNSSAAVIVVKEKLKGMIAAYIKEGEGPTLSEYDVVNSQPDNNGGFSFVVHKGSLDLNDLVLGVYGTAAIPNDHPQQAFSAIGWCSDV